jgi:hypothetical protein
MLGVGGDGKMTGVFGITTPLASTWLKLDSVLSVGKGPRLVGRIQGTVAKVLAQSGPEELRGLTLAG